MARSKSSRRWLKEHFDDPFVKKAQALGLRSRAVFKLQEIQAKDKLLKPGMTVVDLGAAPGGWSEMAREILGKKGRVIALDLLPIKPIEGVDILQGDFSSEETYESLLTLLNNEKVDVVLCDISPNMSGNRTVDQPKGMYLCELALNFAQIYLKPGGSFVCKIFQGEGFDAFLKECRASFAQVVIRKPEASRDRSRETYLVGKKKHANLDEKNA